MFKDKTKAECLLEELRTIPKIIKSLEKDNEAMRNSVLSSPQWSDMKVQGGLKKSQEDKNIAVIDVTDFNNAEIERLVKRRKKIVEAVRSIPDMIQSHVLLVTYANCETFDEAMHVLELTGSRNKYFTIKRKALKSLENILIHTDLY